VDVKWLVLFAAACSSNKSPPKAAGEDARPQPVQSIDAAVKVDPSGKGDVSIRVEWKDVPADARRSPGRTACGTARAPAVTPTTTWGIPDVLVAVDAPSASASSSPNRITFGACAFAPRMLVTTGPLSISSAADAPAKLVVQRAGSLPLGEPLKEDKPRDVYLPITGHDVDVPAELGAIYKVTAADEAAWVVATDQPFVAITEGGGSVVLRGVPAGTHAVTAWLPPRSGQPARVARGKVTVTAGALAEVTLDITKP
jgi:hypothetical protein